jgi:hypothetical protein
MHNNSIMSKNCLGFILDCKLRGLECRFQLLLVGNYTRDNLRGQKWYHHQPHILIVWGLDLALHWYQLTFDITNPACNIRLRSTADVEPIEKSKGRNKTECPYGWHTGRRSYTYKKSDPAHSYLMTGVIISNTFFS